MTVLDNYKKDIRLLCSNHKVKELYAFGSVLSDKFNRDSDIDLLVSFQPIDISLYADNYFDFKFSLQNILKRPVDLLEEKAIKNPYFKQSIDKKKQLIYGHWNKNLVIWYTECYSWNWQLFQWYPKRIYCLSEWPPDKKAVERNIEVIGEAMNRVLQRDSSIELPNSIKIVDTRNRIIHGYDIVSDEIIWGIVINHLPALKQEIDKLLGE